MLSIGYHLPAMTRTDLQMQLHQRSMLRPERSECRLQLGRGNVQYSQMKIAARNGMRRIATSINLVESSARLTMGT